MKPDRSATAWANDLPAGARVPWAELEARVFRGRPGVLAELGGAGAFQRRGEQARSPWFLLAMILAVLPVLALVLLPVLAFTALGGSDFGLVLADSAVAISVAGWLMLASAAWQAVTLVRGLLGGSIAESEAGGWIAAVVGVVAAVMIGARGAADQVPGWPVWGAVAVLAAALGAAVAALARRGRRGTRRSQTDGRRGTSTAEAAADSDAVARRRAAIAAIPAGERERIRSELADAIGILRRRGIVSPADAQHALEAEPGFLAQRMSS
ncbi:MULTISPECIES: hypothetical protein [unclassified Microbacterium]|uniref:hypothetical protein n=1 Tax=unclassified Microbacterium TaxID=2609290 RepID=UPI0036618874